MSYYYQPWTIDKSGSRSSLQNINNQCVIKMDTCASSQHSTQTRNQQNSTPRTPRTPPSFSTQTRKPQHAQRTASSQSQYLVSNLNYSNKYHHHYYNHQNHRQHNQCRHTYNYNNIKTINMQNPNINYSPFPPNPYAAAQMNGNQQLAIQMQAAVAAYSQPQMMQQQYQYSRIPPNPYGTALVGYQYRNHNHNLPQHQPQHHPQHPPQHPQHQPQNQVQHQVPNQNQMNPLKRKLSDDVNNDNNSNNEPPAKKARKSNNSSSDSGSDSDEGGMSLHQLLSQQNSMEPELESDFKNPYHLNQTVETKRKGLDSWLPGKIVDIGNNWIKVHYLGYHEKYDSKVYVDPDHKKFDKYEVRVDVKADQDQDENKDIKPKQEQEKEKVQEQEQQREPEKAKANDKEEMDEQDVDIAGNEKEDEEKLKLKKEIQQMEVMKTVAIQKLKEMVLLTKRKLNKKEYHKVRKDMDVFLKSYQEEEEDIAKEHEPDQLGELYCIYGIALGQLHEYQDAMIACKKCIEYRPKYHKGYTTLAALYAFQEKYPEAIEQYEAALQHISEDKKKRDIQRRRDQLMQEMAAANKAANNDNNHNHNQKAQDQDEDSTESDSGEEQPIAPGLGPQLRRRLPRQAKNKGAPAPATPASDPESDSDDGSSSSDEEESSSSEDEPIKKRAPRNNNNGNNNNLSQSSSPKKGKGVKGTDLDQRKMDISLMSAAQKKAYENRNKDPNAFYYRFNIEGEDQAKGPWKAAEHKRFMERILEKGANVEWGHFSTVIKGRVGYQCSNYWRKLIESNMINDENYVDNGKANGKKRQLKRPEVDAICNEEGFYENFRRFQFTVIEDPSGTFNPLPRKHPRAPRGGNGVMPAPNRRAAVEVEDNGRRGERRGGGRGRGRRNTDDREEKKRIKREKKEQRERAKREREERKRIKREQKEERMRIKEERGYGRRGGGRRGGRRDDEDRVRIKHERDHRGKRRRGRDNDRDRDRDMRRRRGRDRSRSRSRDKKRRRDRKGKFRKGGRSKRDRRGKDVRDRFKRGSSGRLVRRSDDSDDGSDESYEGSELDSNDDSDYGSSSENEFHEDEEKDSEEDSDYETTENTDNRRKVKREKKIKPEPEEEEEDEDEDLVNEDEGEENKNDEDDKEPADEYLCPISYELMEDPVMIRQSGWTYERSAIVEWINENGNDPNTRQACSLDDLIPNRTLRDAISRWKETVGYVKKED